MSSRNRKKKGKQSGKKGKRGKIKYGLRGTLSPAEQRKKKRALALAKKSTATKKTAGKKKASAKRKTATKKKAPKRKTRPKKKAPKKKVRPKKKKPRPREKKKKAAKKTGPSKLDQQWDRNYARAAKMREEEGSMWWFHMTGDDKSFQAWLQTQRYNRKIGRLKPEREARLNEIDFAWDVLDETWQRRFETAKEYSETKGRLWWKNLLHSDPALETWLRTQRRHYKLGELAEDKVQLLERIGFAWDWLDEYWESRFEQLKEFLADNPHGRVTADNADPELAKWVNIQRRSYVRGELAAERIKKLDEIRFQWDGRQAKSDEVWDRNFAALEAFADETGNPNPGPDENDAMFRWLRGQRAAWKTMPDERRELLELLGVTHQPPPGQQPYRPSAPYVPDWDECLNMAAAFKERFGHLRVVRDEQSAEIPGLINFAEKLRSGAIVANDEQRAELDRLEFDWDPKSSRVARFWEDRFQDLVRYKEKHGDCNVPVLSKEYRQLGAWVNRTRHDRNELEPEQRQRLEDLGFVWELKKEWMESQWETRFAELLEYKRQHGDCNVPQTCPEWPTLTRWVSRMRQTRDELSDERRQRLEEVGFVWNAKAAEKAATEAQRYAELVAFHQANGHCRVTRGNDPTGGVLNRWIVRQRDKKKKDNIDAELEERLDALGFLWVTR